MIPDRDRLLELLTDRALVGLGAREQIELAELLVRVGAVDVGAFDNAAAAVALASLDALEAMPASLAARIEQSANGVTAVRPASDFSETRNVDSLAPGFRETQDALPAPTPAPRTSDTQDTLVAIHPPKRTQMMDEGRAPGPTTPTGTATAAPMAAPTDLRSNAPYAHPLSGTPRSLPPMAGSAPPSRMPIPMQAPMPTMTAPLRATAPSANVVPLRAPAAPSRAVAIGGWVAAAACLLLAIGAFALRARPAPIASLPEAPSTSSSSGEQRTATTTSPSGSSGVAAAPSPVALRERLLATAGTTRVDWSPTKDPAGKGATGEVVWNKDQQAGVMRFHGLAKNDPARGQYQLWIFDKTRDEKYPVDGGVFDVDSETGDVLVAIHAALPVAAPSLFAVTLERPGGVVVSKRERLVVTAKPAG